MRFAYVTATSFALGFCATFTVAICFLAFGWMSLLLTVPMCFLIGSQIGNVAIQDAF